jgi:hypothetical protein
MINKNGFSIVTALGGAMPKIMNNSNRNWGNIMITADILIRSYVTMR